MYILTKIIARPKHPGSRYTQVTGMNTLTMEKLLHDYHHVYFALEHHTQPDVELVLRLQDIEDQIYGSDTTLTIQEWLTELGGQSLPVTDQGIEIVLGSVIQSDLLDFGWHATLVDELNVPSAHKHRHDLINVRLTDDSGRYQEYHDYCLFTCNGLLHRHDADPNGIYLEGAGRSTDLENSIQFSSLSFANLGRVRVIPITPDMIRRHNGGRYQDGFYLEVEDEDFANKTVMLSLFGALHYDNQHYSVISSNTIKMFWSHVDFVNRYVDFRHKIDWGPVRDAIDLSDAEGNIFVDRIAAEEDETILAVLALTQSFIIVVDTDNISYDQLVLERTHIPGRYITHSNPYGPVMLGNGLIPTTRVRAEGCNQYSVDLTLNWLRNSTENTRGPHSSPNVMTNNRSQYPQYLSDGFMLKISSEGVKL